MPYSLRLLPTATASGQSPVVVDVQLEVHKTFRDMAKRKLNVIVSGLPEANCSDIDEMKAADTLSFMHLCEEHLSDKPVIAHRGCVCLGQPDGCRPRRLSASNFRVKCLKCVSSGKTTPAR